MGKLKIFPDDIKICPKGWLWVKTIADFKDAVRKNRGDLEIILSDYEPEATDKGKTGLGNHTGVYVICPITFEIFIALWFHVYDGYLMRQFFIRLPHRSKIGMLF